MAVRIDPSSLLLEVLGGCVTTGMYFFDAYDDDGFQCFIPTDSAELYGHRIEGIECLMFMNMNRVCIGGVHLLS